MQVCERQAGSLKYAYTILIQQQLNFSDSKPTVGNNMLIDTHNS